EVAGSDYVCWGVPGSGLEALRRGEPNLAQRCRIDFEMELPNQCAVGLVNRDLEHGPEAGDGAQAISQITQLVGKTIVDLHLQRQALLRGHFATNLVHPFSGHLVAASITGGRKGNVLQSIGEEQGALLNEAQLERAAHWNRDGSPITNW